MRSSVRNFRGNSNQLFDDRSLDALVAALNAGGVSGAAAAGPRTRRRLAAKKLKQAGLLAPLLAAEGCLSLGKDSDALVSGGGSAPDQSPSGPAQTPFGAQDDGGFHTDADAPIIIPTAELVANDAPASGEMLTIVRVFLAVNGTVALDGGNVVFTPNPGYEGLATFRYEAVDSNNQSSFATVELHVGDGDHAHGDSGGDDHGGHTMPHADDPGKQSEHLAVFDLVPHDEATHVAVQSGSWFDPATWADGVVPGEDARVLIPEGVTVQYDGESPVSLFTVRIDGALEFATDVDTFMEVDTLVVAGSGRLAIGSIDHPVSPNVSTVIQIANNGPINTAWDPQLLSRGIISHGEVQIHGAEKETFIRVTADPMAGDTSITLSEAPSGWQVGDKLVVVGTHLIAPEQTAGIDERRIETEDEEVVITRIEGNTVYFDKPLQFDHEGQNADLKTYVANFSRNIKIQTENPDGVPVSERGHVMFMHSDNIDVRYAEFFELGRTDKSERAFDFDDLASTTANSNLKGRYALHIHRAGVNEVDDPAMVVGNAVWGSPGWGFVQHDSNAIFAENAAYDVFGAAFVAETGNEIGRWVHNIAIKSTGINVLAKDKDDVAHFDLGRTGAGFWFAGRAVDAVDNVAAGIPGGDGFIYMSRGAGLIDATTASLDFPEAFNYRDETGVNRPTISQFYGNETIAANSGLHVVKADPLAPHDLRSHLQNFTAWEVAVGVDLSYTARYTLENVRVYGSDSPRAQTAVDGISIGQSAYDIVIRNSIAEGFEHGFSAWRSFTFGDGEITTDFVFIDNDFTANGVAFESVDPSDLFLTEADLVVGRLEFRADYGKALNLWPDLPWPGANLSGAKTDSIGEFAVAPEFDRMLITGHAAIGAFQQEGYWTTPEGNTVVVFDQFISDRATSDILKITTAFDFGRSVPDDWLQGAEYRGVFNPASSSPIAADDVITVSKNGSVTFNPLVNDSDPDGDPINIDGLIQALHGSLYDNGDGTLTYNPDPNYVGEDEFWYWVEDDNGNFDKAHVQVTVEI